MSNVTTARKVKAEAQQIMNVIEPAVQEQVTKLRADILYKVTAQQAYGTTFEVGSRPYKSWTDALKHAKNTGQFFAIAANFKAYPEDLYNF